MIDQDDDSAELEGEEVELPEDDVTVTDTEDGGAMITVENEEEAGEAREHFANIADTIPDSVLTSTATDLLELIERDFEARRKRDELYEEGIKRTGLSKDAPGGATFVGASKVVHPMLVEACVDFSARAMKELMPPSGPVKTKINGKQTQAKSDKAQRKSEFMNWQLTQQIPEFRSELEQITTQLPLGGAQYLKWVYDRKRQRPVPEFVPIDDMILPFAATNFYTAERKTHRQYVTRSRFREKVEAGEYIDVDLPTPEDPEFSKSARASHRIEGKSETSYNEDGLRTIYEVTTTLDIEVEGDYRPYIITIDESTERVLALYRNWQPDDDKYLEIDHAVEFPFIPWRGSAPIGLTHLIGSLAGAATGALRALLDSAHINNVPSGIRLKGGSNGQNVNVQPTQIAEIEGSGAIDDIRKLVMPLPFNPPSSVLYQLLGFCVDAGKGVIQTSFEKLADGNQNAPVGTTLALIEQGMVVFSSIHSRLHAAMERCFKILHRINASYLTVETLEAADCGIEVKPEDFDGPCDVLPISDPAIFSETQRFAQTTAIQQRAAALPEMYNGRKVEEMFLRAMKIDPDEVLNEVPGEEDRDPVSENVAATMGQPIYVLPKQDHVGHFKIHLAFAISRMFGGNPMVAPTALWPLVNHLRDHMLNHYMVEAQSAVKAANENREVPLTVEEEAMLVTQVQQVVESEIAPLQQTLMQLYKFAEQFKPQPQMPQDNSMQVAQLRAQTEQQKAQANAQIEGQKMAQDAQKASQELQLEQMKLQMAERMSQIDASMKQMAEQNRLMLEQMRQEAADRRAAEANMVRERMNTADNDTAMSIAAAEISSGERVGVSTGTGINP